MKYDRFYINLCAATEYKTETFSLYVLMFIIPVFRYPKYVALISTDFMTSLYRGLYI